MKVSTTRGERQRLTLLVDFVNGIKAGKMKTINNCVHVHSGKSGKRAQPRFWFTGNVLFEDLMLHVGSNSEKVYKKYINIK